MYFLYMNPKTPNLPIQSVQFAANLASESSDSIR